MKKETEEHYLKVLLELGDLQEKTLDCFYRDCKPGMMEGEIITVPENPGHVGFPNSFIGRKMLIKTIRLSYFVGYLIWHIDGFLIKKDGTVGRQDIRICLDVKTSKRSKY